MGRGMSALAVHKRVNQRNSIMLFIKTCFVFLLLIKYVQTNVVSNVTCAANGDVYIHTGGQRSDVESKTVSCLFAGSQDTVCNQHVTVDVVKIYGCLQPDTTSGLDVFLQHDTESLLIVRIDCFSAESRRDAIGYHADNELSTARRRRRQDVSSEALEKNVEDVRQAETSATFTVSLNFSSNDEISIVCDTDLGILYLSNPDPVSFKNLLSFSELTKRKCNARYYNGRKFVAVGGCSLDFPITVSFSAHQPHESLIGGSMSNFKVYNITCTDPAFASTALFDVYDYENEAVGNHDRKICVVMVIMTLTKLCEAFIL